MSIGAVCGGSSPIADLTRLAVAALSAQRIPEATSVAVQALDLGGVQAVAEGRLDTYA